MRGRHIIVLLAALGGGLVAAVLGTAASRDGDRERVMMASGVASVPAAPSGSLAVDARELLRRQADGVVGVRARVLRSDPGRGVVVSRTGGDLEIQGSGFALDGDTVVTSSHLVEGAMSLEVVLPDGTAVAATAIGSDDDTDCALLRLEGADGQDDVLRALDLGDSGAARDGDAVVTLADPGGTGAVTHGDTLATSHRVPADSGVPLTVLRLRDAAQAGDLGAPLLDGKGRVLGLHVRIAGAPRVLPAATLAGVIPQLERSGRVDRAYLGVLLGTGGAAAAAAAPVLIRQVAAGSPAAHAGLQAGEDAIEAVGGRAVAAAQDVATALAAFAPGDVVALSVRRDGAPRTVRVRLADRPASLWSSPRDDGAPGL
jgi:S1-C subfamily serine protease